MGRKAIDETGKTYGSRTVIARVGDVHDGRTWWRCQCVCGAIGNVRGDHLRCGDSMHCTSCRNGTAPEGLRHSRGGCKLHRREWMSWKAMWQRCTSPKHTRYQDYGGRGIKVCDRWRSFENFLADMGPRPPGTSLDRIDPNSNYGPGLCRWADAKTQASNKRGHYAKRSR